MITLNALELPEDLLWIDEFAWQPLVQNQQRSLTGKMLIEEGAKVAGRPITLSDGWATRAQLEQLQALLAQPGQIHTLTLHGITHSVVFNHADAALQAEPIRPTSEPEPGDYYRLTLRFLTV